MQGFQPKPLCDKSYPIINTQGGQSPAESKVRLLWCKNNARVPTKAIKW